MTRPPTILDTVRDILRTTNPTEPSGEWSAWDVARQLDPLAHKPCDLFDARPPYPRSDYIQVAADALFRLRDETGGGRYVGGVSRHLYSLPGVAA